MRRSRSWLSIGVAALVAATAAVVLPVSPAGADAPVATATKRVTHSNTGGALSPSAQVSQVSTSADGRYVVFTSSATNLVPNDTNGLPDVFMTDRLLGTNERISVSSSEAQAGGQSGDPSVSDNGRYVVFTSRATNLVSPSLDPIWVNVYVRDRQAGTTTWVSAKANGLESYINAALPRISGDGSKVSFCTQAALETADTNSIEDVYMRTSTGTGLTRVTIGYAGDQVGGCQSSLNRTGSMVAFSTSSIGVVAGTPTDAKSRVYRRVVSSGTNTLVSMSSGGAYNNGNASAPILSDTGTKVLFMSNSDNLIAGTVTSVVSAYVRDISAGTTTLASIGTDGSKVRGTYYGGGLSGDGTRAALPAYDSEIVVGAPCDYFPFVRTAQPGSTIGVFDPTGTRCAHSDVSPSISPNGRYVAFQNSKALVGDGVDTNNEGDAYVGVLADHVFPDVPSSHTFFEEVSWLVDKNITTGFADLTYHPTEVVTRQAVATFLYRMSGQPAFTPLPGAPHFPDVPTTHAAYTAIEWAYKQGIISGYDDGTFKPGAAVTRQTMAKFLFTFAGSPLWLVPRVDLFTDVPVGHPFFGTIGWMTGNGIGKGYTDGSFRPTDPVTRQSAAAFLFRYRWAIPGEFDF